MTRQRAVTRAQQCQVSRIRPILQILTRARLRIGNRIAIGAQRREEDRIRLRVPQPRAARKDFSRRTIHFDHIGRDTESTVPRALRASVRDASDRALFGRVGDAAGDFARDHVEVEADGGADFDGHADGVGGLLGQYTIC